MAESSILEGHIGALLCAAQDPIQDSQRSSVAVDLLGSWERYFSVADYSRPGKQLCQQVEVRDVILYIEYAAANAGRAARKEDLPNWKRKEMSLMSDRSYHNTSSAYSLPNDPTEHERLELQTAALDRMMHDTPCHAPNISPSKILEVGSGTGAITRHLATTYPAATVISNDLSPLPGTLPPNVTFIQGDFLTLPTNSPHLQPESFDYIFSRMLVFGISNWPAYISQCKNLLKPGGYIELQEVDTTTWWDINQNPYPQSPWMTEMRESFIRRGPDMAIATKLGKLVEDAGFVDVEVEEFRWMFGNWKGHPETDMVAEVGTKWNVKAMLGAYKRVLGGGKSKEEMEVVEREMERDFKWEDGKHERFYVIVGRKP